jgi:hypothetical protein
MLAEMPRYWRSTTDQGKAGCVYGSGSSFFSVSLISYQVFVEPNSDSHRTNDEVQYSVSKRVQTNQNPQKTKPILANAGPGARRIAFRCPFTPPKAKRCQRPSRGRRQGKLRLEPG